MKRHRRALIAPILGFTAALALPAPVLAGDLLAEDVLAVDSDPDAIRTEPIQVDIGVFELAPATVDSPFVRHGEEAVAPLPSEALAAIAGREDVTQVVNSRNAATVASNSVGSNSQTGEVAITDNAFENLSGLSVININTGNNVAVNAAINVNISFSGVQ